MSNNISIELLQNREGVQVGGQLLTNSNLSTTTDWDLTAQVGCADVFVFSSGLFSKSTITDCARFHQDITLVEGYQYETVMAIKNFNGGGQILLANHTIGNANVPVANATIIPSGADGSDSGSGAGQYAYIKTRWVQGAANLDKLMIYANAGVTVDISYIRLYRIGTDKSSVFGTLDATTTDDFPLALTFSINSSDDIDARKGAYSKTFKIPATANNNIILKHFNISNSTNLDAPLFDKIPCRMLVGNLFSITGLIQIKDVEVINNKPSSYGCTFLGDNLAWSTLLENEYLSDLQLANSTNLELSAREVIDTFAQDNATSRTELDGTTSVNTSPVVYPVTTYGVTNESSISGLGPNKAIQMARTEYEVSYILSGASTNSGHIGVIHDSGIDDPTNDWRPQVWIYNMFQKIFNNIGYKISSAFIESDNFKKLLYASPNFLFNDPEQQSENNGFIANFKDTSQGAATQANLLFHDKTCRVTSMPVPSSSLWNNYVNFENNAGASDTAEETIQLGGNCGTSLGSCNWQPAPSAGAVYSGGVLQSDTYNQLSQQSGVYYTYWRIGKSGYYKTETSNISGDMQIPKASSGGWGGGGTFNYKTNADVKLKMTLQVDRVGHNGDWTDVAGVANFSNTVDVGNAVSDVNFGVSGFNLPSFDSTAYFNKGDRIRLALQFCPHWWIKNSANNFTDGTTWFEADVKLYGNTSLTWSDANGRMQITLQNPSIPAWGSTYNLQEVLPDTQKQIDFVKGIAHSFNLQFFTNESDKTVYIEPFTDFYLPPKDAIDWTWKLDRSQSSTDSFIKNNFTRRLVFKYKSDDKDWRVKRMGEEYFEGVMDMYPKILDLPNSFPAGETIFENPFFAGTYESQSANISQDTINNNYSAALWQTAYGNREKGYDYLPRLLLYNKHVNPNTYVNQNYAVEGFVAGYQVPYNYKMFQIANVQDIAFGTWSWNAIQTGGFNSVSTFVNRYEFTNQFGLSYGNYWAKDYDILTNTFNVIGNQVGRGLYQRYYQPMIESLINNPKKRVCYIDLKVTDILKLDFRKMVYIDGMYYRVIKVVDYQPHLNVPTKVELQAYNPSKGSAVPNEGVWINNNGNGTGTNPGDPAPWPPIWVD